MCAVSFVSDFYNDDEYRRRMVQPTPFQWPQAAPAGAPWNQETFKLLQELMEKMKQLDEKLGLPDCEDPKKAEWMKCIERRLKKLEKVKK